MEAAGMAPAPAEKGGRRRELRPWEKLAVKCGGGGGALIVGGVLIAVGAGTAALAARRAWGKPRAPPSRPPAVGKAEEMENFDGENWENECQIDRESDTQEKTNFVSKNSDLAETKENTVELDAVGVKTLGETGCVLSNETWEEPKFVLVDGMEKEIRVDLIQSHADVAQNLAIQVLEKSELTLVDEVGKEKEIFPAEPQLAETAFSEVKEVEEFVSSEPGVALDNQELKISESEILTSKFIKEDLRGVHVKAELVFTHTEEIIKEGASGDERTACIDDISELVSTAAQEIGDELVSAVTEEVKNEGSGSGIPACVEEVAGLMLDATKSMNINECRSVHISAELVLDDAEEVNTGEKSSDERTACAEEIAELLLAATEEVNMQECHSDRQRAALLLAAANEILKEEETGVCIGKVDEGTQSTNLEVGLVECQGENLLLQGSDVVNKEEEVSQSEHLPHQTFRRVKFSIVEEIHTIKKEEEEDDEEEEEDAEESESYAEMREQESSTETMLLTEVMEQKKILPALQLMEEQKETILMKKFHASDNSRLIEKVHKGANDVSRTLGEIDEENEEEQKERISTARQQKTTKNDGSFTDYEHSRLLMVLLGMALVLGILCYFNSSHVTELSSQLYQVIFPTVEETQQVEL